MKIEISDAKVSTAQVEVKTLAIKGKQVTLAVFRQIDKVNIMSLDVENARYVLRGFPWGRVNYCTNSCVGEHLHILWQFEDELRTCIVEEKIWRNSRLYKYDGLVKKYSGDSDLNYEIFSSLQTRYEGESSERLKEMHERIFESHNEIYESFTRLPLLFIAV